VRERAERATFATVSTGGNFPVLHIVFEQVIFGPNLNSLCTFWLPGLRVTSR